MTIVLVQKLARLLCGHGDLEQEVADLKQRLLQTIPPSSPPEENTGVISSQDIYNLLITTFPDYAGTIFISDPDFKITSIGELRRFIDWDNTNIFEYEAKYRDCDDAALALAGAFAKYPGWSGFPVTYIWGNYGEGPHAFTIAVAWPSLEERVPSLFYIEPQNDWELAPELMEGMELLLLPM